MEIENGSMLGFREIESDFFYQCSIFVAGGATASATFTSYPAHGEILTAARRVSRPALGLALGPARSSMQQTRRSTSIHIAYAETCVEIKL